MKKNYTEEFKKEVVREYQKGKSYNAITAEYEVPNGTLAAWIKKYSEECKYKNQTTNQEISAKEYRNLQKELAELKKENDFLKKQWHSSQRKSISGLSIY